MKTKQDAINNIIFVPLAQTTDNRYQAGEIDWDKVAEIKQSIQDNRDNGTKGLYQVPIARLNPDGVYELAFARHRRAAFCELAKVDPFWSEIPLMVRGLTDLQMFEALAIENLKRRNINPIEKAELYQTYLSLGKKSPEAAAFFSTTAEDIRSTVRLLKLPKHLQAGVADGSITQTNARRLLTIQRVAPTEVKEVARQLKENPAIDPDTIIADALKNTGNSVEMWPSWRREDEPMAGTNLWSLRLPADQFPMDHLSPLKAASLSKLLLIENPKGELQQWIDWLRMGFIHGPMAPSDKQQDESVSDYLIRKGAPAEVVERIAHLVNPPACSTCPFYAKIGGAHYCAFKECYNRKVRAWQANELEQAIQELGIAAYDHKTDGKCETLSSFYPAHTKLVEDRSPDLRLKKEQTYNNFKGVPNGFVIVAVGKTVEKLKKAEERRDSRVSSDDYYKEQRRLSQMREAHKAAMYEFLWNVATPAFAPLLAPLTNIDFIKEFADRMVRGVPAAEPNGKSTKAVRLEFYRRALLFSLLDSVLDMWELGQKKKPVAATAKALQGIATTWAVKLPKDWMDQAAEADKGIQLPEEAGA